MKLYILFFGLLTSLTALGAQVDCSEVFGKPSKCEQMTCNEKQETFLGTWAGPFQSYSRELSSKTNTVFRPFKNTVTYSAKDCLKSANGDLFIIGRRTDDYPKFQTLAAKTEQGLLVTGTHVDGSPFLKTVDADGINEYQLTYQNKVAVLAIWTLIVPAKNNSPEMRFVTIDGRDFSDETHHKRNVVVTMSIGPAAQPMWEGVVSSGSHTLSVGSK